VQQIPLPLMAERKMLIHLTNHPTQPPAPQPHPGAGQARPPEAPLVAPLEVVLRQLLVAGDSDREGIAPTHPLRQRPTATWRPHQKTFLSTSTNRAMNYCPPFLKEGDFNNICNIIKAAIWAS
jgi:hypothetical protein